MLVVSPLLALMRDQLAHLPPTVPAAMLWGAQPRHEQTAVLQNLSVRLRAVSPSHVARGNSYLRFAARLQMWGSILRSNTVPNLMVA